MSSKFLHRLEKVVGGYDRSSFTRKDFEDIKPYLFNYLANLKTYAELEHFLDDYPEVRKKLLDDEDYNNALYQAAKHDTPLIRYLMSHTPGGVDFYELQAKQDYSSIAIAAYAGQPKVAELLIENAPEGATTQFAKRQAYPLGEFYNHYRGNSIPALLRSLPRKDAIAVIRHDTENEPNHSTRFLLLHEMLSAGHFDKFDEFFHYLPEDEQVECLCSNEVMHALMRYGSDVIHNVIKSAGNEIAKKAFDHVTHERMPVTITWIDPETNESHPITSSEVPNVYALLRNASSIRSIQHGTKCILDLYDKDEASTIISLFNFNLPAQALQHGWVDYFRLLSQYMTSDDIERMFENKPIKFELSKLAKAGDAQLIKWGEGLVPQHYINEAKHNAEGGVNDTTNYKAFKLRLSANISSVAMHELLDELLEKFSKRGIRDFQIALPGEKEKRQLKGHPEFNQSLYDRLLPLIQIASETQTGIDVERDTAKLAILFDSTKGVDNYLANCAKGYGAGASKQPVHDACLFEIPSEHFNTKHWRGVIKNHGPAAARYLGLAPKIEAYAKEHNLPLPTTPPEIADIAYHISYKRSAERPHFARACISRGVSEDQFIRCLDVLEGKATVKNGDIEFPIVLKTSSNIPSIRIDGGDIGHPQYYMEKLDVANEIERAMLKELSKEHHVLNDAEIAVILGEFSNCCQSVGKAGEKFTLHGLTSADGDFYVWKKKIKNKDDMIIAQSWVWKATDENHPSTLVFDSIEPLGTAHNHIFKNFMLEFAKRAKQHGLEQVNIGMGGKTPRDLSFTESEQPARLNGLDFIDNDAEYDSKRQWEVRLANEQTPTAQRMG